MSSFELNKIFAAILVAGIVAMLGGFVSELLMHPHKLTENAVNIDGEAPAAGGAAAVEMPEPILNLIATADVAKGEKLSKACAACHSFDKGGANKVGPNLWNVVGSAKGHHAGFAYSEAMLAHGGNWNYEELNKFLWKPKKLIDGTKMGYAGIKKGEDRAALIAWLRTLHDSLPALPSEGEIAKEAADLAPPVAEVTPAEDGVAVPASADAADASKAPAAKAADAKAPAVAAPAPTTKSSETAPAAH